MHWTHLQGIAVIVAAAAGLGQGLAAPEAPPMPPMHAVAVTARSLPLDPDRPDRRQLDALTFMGALRLGSQDPAFGGISGLAAGPGRQLLGVTDSGQWIAFDTVEADGWLVGVADVRMAPILGRNGRPAPTKADGDAEALAWDPAAGTAQVGYEQVHRVMHFAGGPVGATPHTDERLTATVGWGLNGGGEALAVLSGGQRLIVRETDSPPAGAPDGTREALLTVAGKTRTVFVPGVAGHSPTDAAAIDATRVLLLHRRFSPLLGQGAAITLVDLAPVLAGGSEATARELARWAPPLVIDNMEGLAVRREAGGLALYVVSDDNFNGLQKTVLLKFLAPGL